MHFSIRARRDLNPQPTAPQAAVLSKLHHVPNVNAFYIFYCTNKILFALLQSDKMGTSAGKTCSSCGRLTAEYTEFKCPECGKTTIVRCKACRETYNKYRCKECNFVGP